jgi:hypothetical protein
MVGAEIKGGLEEAVQAVIQEVEFVQEGGLMGPVRLALLKVTLTGEMPEVAGQGGGADAEFAGQGAVGHPIQEAEVNGRAGGVVADGTAFTHTCAPKQEFPQGAGWVQVIKGGERGPEKAGRLAGLGVFGF